MRVLLVMLGVLAITLPTEAKDPEPMIALSPQSLQYSQIPDLPACATAAILRGDPRSGPAWVMLKHDADWRWMSGRADTPWYPTLRLFRQTRPGDWSGVARAIAKSLAANIRGCDLSAARYH